MMKTASLENSKRLVELGVELEDSYFIYTMLGMLLPRNLGPYQGGSTPAPTSDELWAVLTDMAKIELVHCYVDGGHGPVDGALVCLENAFDPDQLCEDVIWLLEQGHLTKEEVMKGAGR